MLKIIPVLFVTFGVQLTANAQENSPYSRYGLGDLNPNHGILSRSMGGISAGLLDYQSLNFVNPATLGYLNNTIFEMAAESDIRMLKSANPPQKFTSVNTLFSYLELAFPVTPKKWLKKKINWGMCIGLRPISRINYKIENNQRLQGVDSLNTVYEGTGGTSLAYIGSGMSIDLTEDPKHPKSFSAGVNIGYMFGNKNYSTQLSLINDTVNYYRSLSSNQTNFGGLFLSGGMQYATTVKSGQLRLGLYGNLQQEINAQQDLVRETVSFDATGAIYRVDSVYGQTGVKGTIIYPSTVGLGFTYQGKRWLYGMDYETSNWLNYKFFEQGDQLQNSWMLRAGFQYLPLSEKKSAIKNYFNYVKYRAGVYYGSDYIILNSTRPDYGISFGTGMPLTTAQRAAYGEYVSLNTAVEIGSRGDTRANLRENTVRISIGISMNARWFQKRKYD